MTLVPMREALATAARGVREGMPLARALQATAAFPPVMVHLIASGETSGRLDESLERAARQQQNDIATRLAAFAALFEPLMIVFMGGAVLAIEAGRTMILERERVIELADRWGICIVALREPLREGGAYSA